MTIEGVLSGLVGAATTALVATWRVATWVRDLCALQKQVREHDERDEKFHAEARDKWDDFGRSLGRLEGANDPWDTKTTPSGRGRTAK